MLFQKKAWRPFGVSMTLKAPGVKNIIEWGTRSNDYIRPTRRVSKRVGKTKTKDKYVYELWFKKVKEWADGVNNTERRIVSVSAINKRDDGTYLVTW